MQCEAQEIYWKKKHTRQQYPVSCSRNTVQKTHRNTMQSSFDQSHLFEVLFCASWWAIVSQSYVGCRIQDGWAPGPIWKGAENLSANGFWSLDHPEKKNSAQKIFWRWLDLPKIYAEDWIWKKSIEALFMGFSHQRMKEALLYNQCFNKMHLIFRNNFNMANGILLLV